MLETVTWHWHVGTISSPDIGHFEQNWRTGSFATKNSIAPVRENHEAKRKYFICRPCPSIWQRTLGECQIGGRKNDKNKRHI